mgnify:CR=1 FL=1
MSTIKEIAYLAGVSRGTVDRVLNNRGAVNPDTAEKVRAIAKAVNYTPNRAGKTLAVKKKQLKFGFILFNSASNPFFLDVVRGIEDRRTMLKEYGASVEIRYAAIDNPDLQVQLIDELLEQGIDGLAITPINHPAVIKRLKKLTKTGFPVVTTNSDIPDCGRIAYVGSDYYKSGETAAGLMNLVCGGQTNAGIILGSPWVLCHSERVAGFTDRIKKSYPGISIVNTVVNNDDDWESFAVTRKLLTQHPEINALYLAAAGVQGACRAVEDLGLRGKIKIISYDTTAPTCKLVREGAIVATIAQQPFTQGAKPLDILLDYLGMDVKPDKDCYYTKIEIKIKENI